MNVKTKIRNWPFFTFIFEEHVRYNLRFHLKAHSDLSPKITRRIEAYAMATDSEIRQMPPTVTTHVHITTVQRSVQPRSVFSL